MGKGAYDRRNGTLDNDMAMAVGTDMGWVLRSGHVLFSLAFSFLVGIRYVGYTRSLPLRVMTFICVISWPGVSVRPVSWTWGWCGRRTYLASQSDWRMIA